MKFAQSNVHHFSPSIFQISRKTRCETRCLRKFFFVFVWVDVQRLPKANLHSSLRERCRLTRNIRRKFKTNCSWSSAKIYKKISPVWGIFNLFFRFANINNLVSVVGNSLCKRTVRHARCHQNRCRSARMADVCR